MGQVARAFGIVTASTAQSAGLVLAAHFGSQYLTKRYPIEGSWSKICFGVAVIGIAHSQYILIRFLVRSEAQRKKNSKR